MTLKRIYPWHKESNEVKFALKQSINNGNKDSEYIYSAINYRAGIYGFGIAIVFSATNISSIFLLGGINAWASVNSFWISLVLGFVFGALIAPTYMKRILFIGLDIIFVESTINNALQESGRSFNIRIINYSWFVES